MNSRTRSGPRARLQNRAVIALAGLSAIAATTLVAVPALGANDRIAPASATATSPAKVAKQALTLAKAADKRSKQALAAAKLKTPGPAGANGANGASGTNGKNGTDGTNGVGQPGPPGSTLKPQLNSVGPVTSGGSLGVPFTQAADKAYLVGASMTVTPPPSAMCTGGGEGMQVDVFLDTQDQSRRIGTTQVPPSASPVGATFSTGPGFVMRAASATGHTLIVVPVDNCTGGGDGSVGNVKIDLVEFGA